LSLSIAITYSPPLGDFQEAWWISGGSSVALFFQSLLIGSRDPLLLLVSIYKFFYSLNLFVNHTFDTFRKEGWETCYWISWFRGWCNISCNIILQSV